MTSISAATRLSLRDRKPAQYSGAGGLGLPTSDDSDTVIAVFDQRGLLRMQHIGGPGNQSPLALEALGDGTFALALRNSEGSGREGPLVTVGSTILGEDHHDIIQMLP
jgi:hypothetical protein